MLTAQEKFNLAWKRAHDGVGKGNDGNGSMVRDDDGIRCLTGEIITDEFLEKYPAANLYNWSFVLPEIKEEDKLGDDDLISQLQYCYDFLDPWDWDYRLREIAKERGLSIPRN